MKITLVHTPIQNPQQIGELTSSLDSTHTKVLKVIERLNKDVAAKKAEIANRWKNFRISMQDRVRLSEEETSKCILEIRENSKAELDRLFKEAGETYNQIVTQKIYYDNPVKVLSRHGLGDPRRTDYILQLQHAGSAEMANIGQLAVATDNAVLAAAVLSRLDAMPTNQRPFSAHDLALAVKTDFGKVAEYLKIAEVRFQGIVLAVRAWNAGKANPIDTVSLAMRQRTLDKAILEELRDEEQ